jgi:acyl-CoA:6-aminopenicillanic acid acyl transferase
MIPFVALDGPPARAGQRHGAARGPALRKFLADRLGRVNALLPEPVTLAGLAPLLREYRDVIGGVAPDLVAEIDGLAQGAGISRDEALFLQVRREILGYRRVPTGGDCTTFARTGPRPLLAQTVDLSGNLDDQLAVLEVSRSDVRRRALVLSFAGLLGYLGVNSDGLAIGLNLVVGGEWGPGLPPYLAIRHLLDNAGSVGEAVEVLRKLPLASSRCLVLCDRTSCVAVEACAGQVRVLEGREIVHTNHFLHPDFAAADALNVFARNSSVRRLAAGRQALGSLSTAVDAETCFVPLSQPPVLVPDVGDIRLERTVAAVVMFPADGELHVRRGDPSVQPTEVFHLRKV